VFTYNLDPVEYGMKVRPGFGEWQIDIENTSGLGVRTLIPVNGVTADKLFAVTNEGIWDVTADDGTPSQEITFTTDTTITAGHGVYLQKVLASADEILLYADSTNGLYEYDINTDTWAAKTDITGVDELDICFVMMHKQRIWLIERDSGKAWYLGVGAISGPVSSFTFADKFPHGGTLKALINWSVDGGAGLDDYLVAVSSSGDVVVYKGADPSTLETASADGWAVVGTYYIGNVPEGRRFYSEHSGELYLLSAFGFIGMRDLLKGADVKDAASNSLTYPIASILRKQLSLNNTSLGWEPIFLPSLGRLLINSPQQNNGEYIQYSMTLATEGWGLWRGVPSTVFAEWNNKVYFGSEDNKVYAMDTTKDYVLNDTNDAAALGTPIEFSLLTSYSHAGSPGIFKIGQFVRPDFLVGSSVSFRAKIFYDYSVGESQWDSAIWDTDVFASDELIKTHKLNGAIGIGRTMAIAIRGESSDEARLISFDVGWTKGNGF
jgi:hypothetical protein